MRKLNELRNVPPKKIIRWLCLITSGVLVTVGYLTKNFNVLCVSMLCLLIHNTIYAFESIKDRVIFLMLHITIFTFLISRPFIGMLRGEKWWLSSSQAAENIYFSINIILLSMLFLYIGGVAGTYIYGILEKKKQTYKREKCKNIQFRNYLQVVAMVAFYVTMCFFMIQEGEKLLYMRGRNYVEYYTGFHSQLPGIFYTIASFMRYSLCIFLATFPSKKRAFIPLCLFELSAIPELFIGVRNPIMLNSIFIFLYYMIRNAYEKREKWIGKIETLLLVIAVPVSLIFMTAYSYIRSGMEIAQKNIFKLFFDFFYGQGVTFNVLGIAYGHRNNLPERAWRNYTFGGMIDYIVHGRIGQTLFGTEPLPEGNNWTNGTLSNNFSHNFSYLVRKDDYLNGQGWGSSYMLETYIDYGYIGLVIFNLILGILLVYMLKRFGKNTLLDTVFLVSLTTVFLIPRAEATGWLSFIVTAQFWGCIAACYFGAYICTKCKWLQKILEFLHLYPRSNTICYETHE